MSIAVIKIKKEEIPILKKLVTAFTGSKIRIINDEEDLMAKLIDEGLASKTISTELFKKELEKHANSH
ncbi:MAG TPA: hypothetical protein VK809_12395 [Bacteroidia bacterium]|jgi:hypothetical protein|nr:hypothetical protein [Bacteroidia bacterium]